MEGLKYALWCVPCLLATKTYVSCVRCLSVFLFSFVPRLSFVPPPPLGDLSDHYWMDLDWMLTKSFNIWELHYTWVGFGSYVWLLKKKDVNRCWFENFSHGCLVCLDTLVWHRAGTRLGMAFLCKHRNTEIHECQYRYAEVPSILRGDIYVNICSLSR